MKEVECKSVQRKILLAGSERKIRSEQNWGGEEWGEGALPLLLTVSLL